MNKKSEKLWQLVAILAINLTMLILVSAFSADAARLGDSGERIAKIQHELRRENIFSGRISGFFDFETRRSIAEFQSLSGIERSGEADFATLCALGLDSRNSDCFSARAELLARCVQQSGCRTYPEMLEKCYEIIGKTDGVMTLGRYISENFPDFVKASVEPSVEAYNAAINAMRKAAQP